MQATMHICTKMLCPYIHRRPTTKIKNVQLLQKNSYIQHSKRGHDFDTMVTIELMQIAPEKTQDRTIYHWYNCPVVLMSKIFETNF